MPHSTVVVEEVKMGVPGLLMEDKMKSFLA